jgi:hypothetical protein
MINATPPAALPVEKGRGTHFTGGSVGPSAGLNGRGVEKISGSYRHSKPGQPSTQSTASHDTDYAIVVPVKASPFVEK